MKLVIRLAASIALVLAWTCTQYGLSPQPAVASCAAAQPLQQALAAAPIVFIGKVLSTRNQRRTASVRVQDVWRGINVPHTVMVRGSYVTGHAATSVDRFFQRGVKYLFVPEPTKRVPPYQDNNCTATRPYTADLAQYRPPSAHRP